MRIFNRLWKRYGDQGWWPIVKRAEDRGECVYDPSFKDRKRTADERFEICIGAILTQNTNWNNVVKALVNLKESDVLDSKSLEKMREERLAKLIRPAGYYNQKVKKIKAFVSFKEDITRANLLSLWGIGPETADSILLYAYDQPYFVVDAYTRRIFSRLGLIHEDASYEYVQEYFHKKLKHDARLYNEYHALLVEHAKQHCRKKPICEGCPLKRSCDHGKSL